MPELPDIVIYREALERRIVGETLTRVRLFNAFLLRTAFPPVACDALFSGIGGAYSDEILFRARLSPLMLSASLSDDEIARLYLATREVLAQWTDRLRKLAGDEFPASVTAFRDDMAVHGRFGKPCPDCGSLVQRIVYSETETNYCARCQTGGRILADRALSRLLHQSWPKTLDELE